jgi:hypothetical protein
MELSLCSIVIGQPCRAVSRQGNEEAYVSVCDRLRKRADFERHHSCSGYECRKEKAGMETASRRRGRGPVYMKSTCAKAGRRQRRPHTISGAAGLSRAATYLQTMPSAAAFQWVLAKKLVATSAPLKPRQHVSSPPTVIVKNSIAQSLASPLLLYILPSIRERLLWSRHLHCRRPSG